MGFLQRLFHGASPQHPPLAPDSPPAVRISPFTGELEALAGKVHDGIEVVPGEDKVFVIVGRPPAQFGVVRLAPDGEDNLIQVMKEAKLSSMRIQKLSDQAREAYVEYREAPRFTRQFGRKTVTVIDSEPLGQKLDAVFASARG